MFKVLFVYPKFDKFLANQDDVLSRFLRDRSMDFSNVASFVAPPALGIPILMALTPEDIEVRFVDDQLEAAEHVEDVDLAAVSFFTPQATRAYEICDAFRARGVSVVVGGMHPTSMPQEASQHADAVCVGEGESVWREILDDAKAGSLKPIYKGYPKDGDFMPLPNRGPVYATKGYTWETDVVQVARGCPMPCDLCVIPGHFGLKVRFRAIDQVVADVASLSYSRFYLADDQVFHMNDAAIDYAHELFAALDSCGKEIFVNSALSLNCSDNLLKRMQKAGVTTFYCTLGIDHISRGALRGNRETVQKTVEFVRRVQDHGMIFFASFVLGTDDHGPQIKDQILELCRRANIQLAEFFISIPIPGTKLWHSMNRQSRILHRNWKLYNGSHVVFRPRSFSPEKLQQIFLELWADFAAVGQLKSSTERERFMGM